MRQFLRLSLRSPFSRKQRVRELADAKISLGEEQPAPAQTPALYPVSYAQLKGSLSNLGWETMSFDKLCSLPRPTVQAIQMEIKKDKFNVADSQFYEFGSKLGSQQEASLGNYYGRLLALITNDHSAYDQLRVKHEASSKYLAQIYVYDLENDKQLQTVIAYFINNLQFPIKLEALAEPTLVKRLLTIKRELMIQGVKFESQKTLKEARKSQKRLRTAQTNIRPRTSGQQDGEMKEWEENESQEREEQPNDEDWVDQSRLEAAGEEAILGGRWLRLRDQLSKYSNEVKVVRVVGYEYEFWVDVKHNRSKNGEPEEYVIEEREIPNPNETLLLISKYPTIKIKYIVRKRKRKDYQMHFCTKAEVEVLVNERHRRRIKVEWVGPSSKPSQDTPEFRVIDYEGLMKGNPTIKSVFQF